MIEIGSPEWIEMRRNYITATDAAVIMGMNPYKSPLQLYDEKVEGKVSKMNDAMKRGIDLEPDARSLFEHLTGHKTEPQWKVNEEWAWMAATLDGWNDEGVLVEIKCPGIKTHSIVLNGLVPDIYIPQVIHQMYVCKIEKGYFFSYLPEYGEPYALVEFKMDHDFLEEMLRKEKIFWEILINREPEKLELLY